MRTNPTSNLAGPGRWLATLVAGVALALAVTSIVPARALAQEAETEGRNDTLERAFAEVSGPASEHVVSVTGGGEHADAYGVVIEDGLVLTTARVVEGLDRPAVVNAGRRPLQARVRGTHAGFNLALLEVDGSLPDPIATGSSGDLEVGQWLVAVSTRDRPAAVGIVSATDREVEQRDGPSMGLLDMFGLMGDQNQGPQQDYDTVIQHDAPIESDELGTPVVDAEGRLVGLNVGRAYRGSSYAAGIDEIRSILPDLRAGRSVESQRTGWLGVQAVSVDADELESLGVESGGACRIVEVVEDSPAEAGGLRTDDLIVEAGGAEISGTQDVGRRVRETGPGNDLELRVLRDGEERTLTITIGTRGD